MTRSHLLSPPARHMDQAVSSTRNRRVLSVLSVGVVIAALVASRYTLPRVAPLALWARSNPPSGVTAQSPLPRRVAAVRSLVADAQYWLGVQPREWTLLGLRVDVFPQTTDPQRAYEDVERIGALALDQPFIEQDVTDIQQAFQSIRRAAALHSVVVRGFQTLGGPSTTYMSADFRSPVDYSGVTTGLDMITAALQDPDPQPLIPGSH